MNELEAILALAEAAQLEQKTSLKEIISSPDTAHGANQEVLIYNTQTTLALATVVKVQGSTYRKPGARMLMTADGRRAGIISGGCLESDVQERAQQVMATGKPRLMIYDSTAPDDIVFGLGLGCNGIVQVLIEPLDTDDSEGLLAFFSACYTQRTMGKIVTVFQTEYNVNSFGIAIGSRLLQWPDGRVTSSRAELEWPVALTEALRETEGMRSRREGRAVVQQVALETGSLEVLLETIEPPVSLLVFGAGDDVIPVTRCAKLLGWQVTVLDARPAYARPERFPAADAVLCLRPESLPACPPPALRTGALALIMTHNYTQDRELLQALLTYDLRYVGILGPRARTTRLLEDLVGEGITFPPRQLACLHSPAGLDIGAETPEEIALSLLAEMQAVLANRAGGPLWQRTQGIHDTVKQ